MLEETGVPYDRVLIDVRDPARKQHAGFAAASPFLKVPALTDGDVKMADSAAICMYLADRYPTKDLAPAVDDPRRGMYLFWMVFAPGAIDPAVGERVSGAPTNPYGSGWGDFDRMLDTLEKGLADGPWLLGDQFTAADVMVGGSLIIMEALGLRPERQRLRSYMDRCIERPRFRAAEAVEIAAREQRAGTAARRRRQGGPRRR